MRVSSKTLCELRCHHHHRSCTIHGPHNALCSLQQNQWQPWQHLAPPWPAINTYNETSASSHNTTMGARVIFTRRAILHHTDPCETAETTTTTRHHHHCNGEREWARTAAEAIATTAKTKQTLWLRFFQTRGRKQTIWPRVITEAKRRCLLASPQYASVLKPRQNHESNRGQKRSLH